MSEGFIYIFENPAFALGLLKIGKTQRHPAERAAELSADSGVPHPFRVAFVEYADDCGLAERLIHERLSPYRYHQKEFFEVSLEVAIEEARKVLDQLRFRPTEGRAIADVSSHPAAEMEALDIVLPPPQDLPERSGIAHTQTEPNAATGASGLPGAPSKAPGDRERSGTPYGYSPKDASIETRQAGRTRIKIVEGVSIYCPRCDLTYTQALLRYEQNARCPKCHGLTMVKVDW